jgi:COP9 signalosome complex subunit 1
MGGWPRQMGCDDQGNYYYKRGDLPNALKCYQRVRDYCSTPKHIVQMCMSVVRVALECEQYGHVAAFANKALATPDIAKDVRRRRASLPLCCAWLPSHTLCAVRWVEQVQAVSKLMAALGLQALHLGQYRTAAEHFSKVSFELGAAYSDVRRHPLPYAGTHGPCGH